MSAKQSHLKAITLIEVIIYLLLFSVIILTIFRFFLAVQEYQVAATYRNELQQTFIFIDQHMQQSFIESSIVNESASLFSNPVGGLALESDVGPTYRYYVSNQQMFVAVGSIGYELTPDTMQVDEFRIEPIRNTDGTVLGGQVTMKITHVNRLNVSDTLITTYLLNSL